MSDQRNLSTALVSLLARAEDVDPVALDPLYHTIDPDALDAVCDPASGFESIEFTYHEYLVTVRAGEAGLTIELEPEKQAPGAAVGKESPDTESLL